MIGATNKATKHINSFSIKIDKLVNLSFMKVDKRKSLGETLEFFKLTKDQTEGTLFNMVFSYNEQGG